MAGSAGGGGGGGFAIVVSWAPGAIRVAVGIGQGLEFVCTKACSMGSAAFSVSRPEMRLPLTRVPFVDPRSSMTRLPSRGTAAGERGGAKAHDRRPGKPRAFLGPAEDQLAIESDRLPSLRARGHAQPLPAMAHPSPAQRARASARRTGIRDPVAVTLRHGGRRPTGSNPNAGTRWKVD